MISTMCHLALLGAMTFFFATVAGTADRRTGGASSSPTSRETLSLDQGWRFHLGDIRHTEFRPNGDEAEGGAKGGGAWGAAAPEFDDRSWRELDLPHDWVVEQSFDPDANRNQGYRRRGIAWYRRQFKLEPSDRGKHLELQFDGVSTHCTVWFNGTPVHRNWNGYTSFYIDVTPMARYGDALNTIAVRVDADDMEGWWYEGGGIYRHTYLVKRNPVHIVTDGVYANPVKSAKRRWSIPVEMTLENSGNASSTAGVEVSVADPQGKQVAESQASATLSPWQRTVVTLTIPVASPEVWSVDRPNLYTLTTKVVSDGKADEAAIRCGFRTIRFDAAKGFFLNDQPLKLYGVCDHQDHAGVGVAVPDSLWEFRLRKLKEMGANACRTAHNPPSREFLDACDRLGMLVMDENRHFNTSAEYLAQLEWLVRRDRNHPSVILWSLFNEENALQGTAQGREMARRMMVCVKSLDSTRPITAAQNGGQLNPENVAQVLDVVGINYQTDKYDRIRAAYPNKPIVSTEDTSQVMTRGAYVTDWSRLILAAYDEKYPGWASTNRSAWEAIAGQPSFGGGFIWTGFDYRGEPTPFGWPATSSYFGCMDMCGFPKTAFYIRQALWRQDKPILTLVPHWNWAGKEGQPIKVMALTNADTVALSLNGRLIEEKPVDRFEMVEWQAPYAPGKLEAVARKNGKEVARYVVETTGEPAALRLTPDRAALAGDGSDALPVTVEALDKDGRPVPTADLSVDFEISGPGAIIGVGNGDPTSHEPEKGNRRSLFNGLAQVVVQSRRGGSGNLVLRAKAEGLKPAETAIGVRATPLPPSAPAISASAHEIYVSPAGSDDQPGTSTAPVRSLEAARKLAGARAGKEPVTITVEDGIYYLEKPLALTGEDSGSVGAPVVYRAAHEGKAVLSGGVPLQLHWEPYRNGIFKARTPSGTRIDQLFINGTRQIMARYPNYDPTKKDVPYRGAAADAISPERVSRWADPTGGYIHAMHPSLWGGFDYRITGKAADGTLTYEGGRQNNRPAGMHPRFRMVENIFEELDAPGEWFHDRKTDTLYFFPPAGMDPAKATVEGVRLSSLVEFQGSREKPVRFVIFDGFTMRHTARTFMLNEEPLLRSDWTIYRGGTVLFTGTEDCELLNTFVDQPGGNAVFVNNYNRRVRIAGLHVFDCGGSAVAFVGDPAAVRSPLFRYDAPHDFATIDRTTGPRTDNYPMECILEDSLLHEVGTVEKQGAGVQISMSRRITVRHCSIYDTSRAGININEGTWGGHVIEGCDVFRTVQETGDHGSFNSWGRDRFWAPDPEATAVEVARAPKLPFLDAIEPNTIRDSRWRCDHGWDIDLDDGSTNYIITNNLLLHGGLKLREGYRRIVTNNILVNNTLHPHVWYPDSGDVFTGNIVMEAYRPAVMRPGKWGREIDRNLFAGSDLDRTRFADNGTDANSVAGDPRFADPARGDFTVKNETPAKAIGFKNIPMDRFGVQKASLKAISETPVMPRLLRKIDASSETVNAPASVVWMGATLREPREEEMSAYGVSFDTKGVAIEQVDVHSPLGGAQRLRKGDLILEINRSRVRGMEDARRVFGAVKNGRLQLRIVRHQKETTITLIVSGITEH